MNESVLDRPKKDLDQSVWTRGENGEYELTQEAQGKISQVVEWVLIKTRFNNLSLRITGSITSNQYSEKSDIDLHFNSSEIKEGQVEELNRVMRDAFENEYSLEHPNDTAVGTHKLEIYFQANPHQDMMSIGCYDFFQKRWLVGPEFLSLDYDPYSEYFNEDMKYVKGIIDDIRNVILQVYETTIVLRNSQDEQFVEYESDNLVNQLAKAANIFTKAREYRKVYSSPRSDEEALTMRNSRKWKIADSAFKLLDKFGYLGILREMSRGYDAIENDEKTVQEVIPEITGVVQSNIMSNPELQNVDKELFESLNCEGMGNVLATIATIVSMIAIPNVTNAEVLKKELKDIPPQHFKISDPMVTNAMNVSSKENKMFGKWSFANLTNLVSTIAYNEGMEDYTKPNANGQKHDDRILQAIIWTIINRAGGNVNRFANVILEPSQYFSTKHVVSKDPEKYVTYHPGFGYDKKTWKKCNEFAVMALNGTLPMPKDDNGVEFGKRNMIANKKRDNAKAFDSWGEKCDFTFGGKTLHTYGYDSAHDGYKSKVGQSKTKKSDAAKSVERTHTVAKGENLSSIAKRYKTTVEKILKKNPSIKDPNQIKIGNKLKI